MSSLFNLKRITQHYNLQLFLCSGLLTLSSANYAFDNQGLAQTQAMDPFIRRFGEQLPSGAYAIPAYFLSLMNGLVFVGFALGIWIGSVISARYGRRMTCFTMSIWALCSATIMITAQNRYHMLVSRILNYIYVGMELSVIPVFQAEIMPAPVRGFAVASYQMSFALGGIVMSGICRGTSTLSTDAAWRIPLGCFYVVPSIIAGLIWFIPESPRWLISQGKIEQARTALFRLRVNATEASVSEEITSVQLGLDIEKDKGSYADLFRGNNRRRTLIIAGTNFFLQATGQAFASQYGTIFVRSLGTINPFDFSLMNSFIGTLCCLTAMVLVDKIGRRPLMIAGSGIQAVWLFVMGAAGSIATQTPATRSTVAAMLALFNATFVIGWAPLNYIIMGELPEQRLRDKSQRFGSWINIATNCVVSFTLPYMLFEPANLGGRVGFIYGSMAACACLFAIFCIPECKGRTLEEVNLLFVHKISAIASSKWKAPNLVEELADRSDKQVMGDEDAEKREEEFVQKV